MNPKHALCCHLENSSQVKKFEAWLTKVKCVDNLANNERSDFEAIAKVGREAFHRNNILAEPSHCNNTNTAVAGSSNTNNCDILPKILDSTCQLLYDNEGYLKCRHVFILHRSKDCPNDFPKATTYKNLTQNFVDLIKQHLQRKTTAAVVSQAHKSDSDTVFVVYMPSDMFNVIEGTSDSDSEVSLLPTVTSIIYKAMLSGGHKAPHTDIASLTVSHMFWKCSINGEAEDFPVLISAMIDHGSHLVLISEDFTTALVLKHCKLHAPMAVEVAIPDKTVKHIISLSEWVKLWLYDPSGSWTSKTVRAIIAPLLCTPIILGLPFLEHNNIVIDHACCTVIDKVSGFDLMNPKLQPIPIPPSPKCKLKQLFCDLKEDQKLMVTELKMVCAERRCKI